MLHRIVCAPANDAHVAACTGVYFLQQDKTTKRNALLWISSPLRVTPRGELRLVKKLLHFEAYVFFASALRSKLSLCAVTAFTGL